MTSGSNNAARISGGNFGGVGGGGGGGAIATHVELPICRKFSFYRKFGDT